MEMRKRKRKSIKLLLFDEIIHLFLSELVKRILFIGKNLILENNSDSLYYYIFGLSKKKLVEFINLLLNIPQNIYPIRKFHHTLLRRFAIVE
jgi:hypothetical protein